ncbi:MAG TPA: hypothetical protein VLF69_01825 [Candidatus Saccharimonadales bacterium]|nr:hypothetical protein [Candidatus Saccharimonadales bacterium]
MAERLDFGICDTQTCGAVVRNGSDLVFLDNKDGRVVNTLTIAAFQGVVDEARANGGAEHVGQQLLGEQGFTRDELHRFGTLALAGAAIPEDRGFIVADTDTVAALQPAMA